MSVRVSVYRRKRQFDTTSYPATRKTEQKTGPEQRSVDPERHRLPERSREGRFPLHRPSLGRAAIIISQRLSGTHHDLFFPSSVPKYTHKWVSRVLIFFFFVQVCLFYVFVFFLYFLRPLLPRQTGRFAQDVRNRYFFFPV